jgi:hypothetical protein
MVCCQRKFYLKELLIEVEEYPGNDALFIEAHGSKSWTRGL